MSGGDFKRHSGGLNNRKQKLRRFNVDITLTVLLLCLSAVGLVALYSAAGEEFAYVRRQAIFMGAGTVLMLLAAQINASFLERWSLFFYAGGLLLLVAVLFVGVGAKGAQRWLDFGATRIQPSELMKVAVPLYLAAYLGSRPMPPKFKHVLGAVFIMLVPPILVGMQPDLGTALVIAASGFFVLLLAGLRKRYLVSTVLLGLAALPVFWFSLLHDYQKTRILTLLDPQKDRLGAGWNIIQSTTAIGSGGMEGKGYLQGTQSQLNFLPESHTDFIIAVLAEEFGFVGVAALLVLYLLIVVRCMFICLRAPTNFGRLFAGSITLSFFVYIFVNMGMVSGILPVVGMPLPFMSYGGTAIMTMMLGFGVLMAVSTDRKA